MPTDPATNNDAAQRPDSLIRKVQTRATGAARRFVIIFVYLWVLFGLFVINEKIVLNLRGIAFTPHGFAFLNALVLAKVMVITEDINLGRWFRRRPLIYPILFESLLLAMLFIGIRVIERTIVGLAEGNTLAASIPSLGGGGLIGTVSVALILFMSLIPFFGIKYVGREIGPDRLRAILFGTGADIQRGR
jgi:hypothetical protein